jgi:Iron-binding zinc finger CDGSH type
MAFVAALPVLHSRLPARAAASPSRPRAASMCAAAPLNADGALPMKEMYSLAKGKKAPICRCWQSKAHPMCDGSHNSYNKETGSLMGPLVVSVADDE